MSDMEVGWVIEEGRSAVCSPVYFAGLLHGQRIVFKWSKLDLDAVRFARAEDADRMLTPDLGHRVCEHMWGPCAI